MGKVVWFEVHYRDKTFHMLNARLSTHTLVPAIAQMGSSNNWLQYYSISMLPNPPQLTLESEDLTVTFQGSDLIRSDDGTHYLLNAYCIASHQEFAVAAEYREDGTQMLTAMTLGQTSIPQNRRGLTFILSMKEHKAQVIDNDYLPFEIVRIGPKPKPQYRTGWIALFTTPYRAITKGELNRIGNDHRKLAKRRTWPKHK